MSTSQPAATREEMLKELQGEKQTLGRRIKHLEENIKFLKAKKNSFDDSILDLQVTLGTYHSARAPVTEGEDISMRSEEETVVNILKHEKSAAAIVWQLKTRHGAQEIPLTKDILGIVAMLGKVNDENLSGLLSEYLGMRTMLGVICTKIDGVKALEKYDRECRPFVGRCTVICLEHLRPYVGKFVAGDSQRRLDLLKPKLPSGESPPGFLGFAVNMIHIDSSNLFSLTTSGHGLRETLFYHLFSELQVYRTRQEMLQALPLLSHGAISMDGGIFMGDGVFLLGIREDLGVKFPIISRTSYLPENYVELEEKMKEVKWKRELAMDDLKRQEANLMQARYCFEMKKQEILRFLAQGAPNPAQNSTNPAQHPFQAAQGRTTRKRSLQ